MATYYVTSQRGIYRAGSGNDSFIFADRRVPLTATQVIEGGAGTDSLVFTQTVPIDIADAQFTRKTSLEIIDLSNSRQLTTAVTLGALATVTGIATVTGSAGGDTINAAALGHAVYLSSQAGNDWLTGSSFGDTLIGGSGEDSLYGGNGNDSFHFISGAEMAFDATVSGGNDIDTVVFTVAEADVADADFLRVSSVEKVQLAAGGNTADFGALAAAAGIATLTGGSGIDRISTWNALAVTVTGGAGQDVFAAGNTSQMTITDLALDNDAEIVTNAAGSTVNATLAGHWTATGATANNAATYAGFTLNTAAFNVDLGLATGSGYKVVGTGSASVVGSAGADYLQTGNNTDYGNVTLTGGAGIDDFYVLRGTATITDLGNGADLFQVEGPGVLDATLVSDWIATGDSWRQPGSGAVTLRVGNAYNLNLGAVNFGVGFTVIKTGSGTIRGTQMADEIRVLPGGGGNLYGNLGADLFNNQGINSGSMTIMDLGLNNESDSIINGGQWISPGASVYAFTAGNWTATSTTINNNSTNTFTIRAQNANTVDLSLASVSNALISGYSVMSMGTGAIVGSSANDIFYKDQGGNAQFTGGLGADTFRSVSSNGFIMTITDLGFNDEADIVIVTAGSVTEATVVGDWTATSQTLNQGAATLTGTAAGNHIDLSEANAGTLGFTINADAVTASAITGSAGNDTINGSLGTDYLVGGAGADRITGNAAADTILLSEDLVTDEVVFTTFATWDDIYDFVQGPGGDQADFSLVPINTELNTALAGSTLINGAGGSVLAADAVDFSAVLVGAEILAAGDNVILVSANNAAAVAVVLASCQFAAGATVQDGDGIVVAYVDSSADLHLAIATVTVTGQDIDTVTVNQVGLMSGTYALGGLVTGNFDFV